MDQAANRKKEGSKGGRPVSHDADLYKERNTVERLMPTPPRLATDDHSG
jgi:hypothetical protein